MVTTIATSFAAKGGVRWAPPRRDTEPSNGLLMRVRALLAAEQAHQEKTQRAPMHASRTGTRSDMKTDDRHQAHCRQQVLAIIAATRGFAKPLPTVPPRNSANAFGMLVSQAPPGAIRVGLATRVAQRWKTAFEADARIVGLLRFGEIDRMYRQDVPAPGQPLSWVSPFPLRLSGAPKFRSDRRKAKKADAAGAPKHRCAVDDGALDCGPPIFATNVAIRTRAVPGSRGSAFGAAVPDPCGMRQSGSPDAGTRRAHRRGRR